MRRSQLKTTVAVLRNVIGLGQKEFAALVKRSTATIQSLELGRLKLSDELAQQIVRKTGVSLEWLLNNDVEAPIAGQDRAPFTRETFENKQASLLATSSPRFDVYFELYMTIRAYANIALAAKRDGKVGLFQYKAARAMRAFQDEFGYVGITFGASSSILTSHCAVFPEMPWDEDDLLDEMLDSGSKWSREKHDSWCQRTLEEITMILKALPEMLLEKGVPQPEIEAKPKKRKAKAKAGEEYTEFDRRVDEAKRKLISQRANEATPDRSKGKAKTPPAV